MASPPQELTCSPFCVSVRRWKEGERAGSLAGVVGGWAGCWAGLAASPSPFLFLFFCFSFFFVFEKLERREKERFLAWNFLWINFFEMAHSEKISAPLLDS